MRVLFTIISINIVCQYGFAQFDSLDKLTEDLVKPPPIDPAVTNSSQLKSELMQPDILPKFTTNKPKVITKQNKYKWNIPFTLTSIRATEETVFFRLGVYHKDKLTHFTHADLYSGDDAHNVRDAFFSGQQLHPDRKATMRVLVPMDTDKKGSTNRCSMGSFQIPVKFTEQTSLRLLCKEHKKGQSFMKLNVYVINLESFVPEVRKIPDSNMSTNDTIDIKIEI